MLEINYDAIAAAKTRILSGQYNDPRQTDLRPLEPAFMADYIERNGWTNYSSWFLAIDTDEDETSVMRYRMPYGDLEFVSRAQLRHALEDADRYGEFDIERAISDLIQVLDED